MIFFCSFSFFDEKRKLTKLVPLIFSPSPQTNNQTYANSKEVILVGDMPIYVATAAGGSRQTSAAPESSAGPCSRNLFSTASDERREPPRSLMSTGTTTTAAAGLFSVGSFESTNRETPDGGGKGGGEE